MKVSFPSVALLLGLWLTALVAAAQTPERLLIIEVSAEDEPAAARLRDLSAQPAVRQRDASARDVVRARAALVLHDAARAVVIDTAQQRVQVVERDGSMRTRLIEDEPTPYVVAFVASELLMLEAVERPIAPPVTAPEPPVLARFDGQLSMDVARPYTTNWLVRPQLALGLWFAARRLPHALPLFGLTLAGPANVARQMDGGRLSVMRWDGSVRLGLSMPLGRVRLLAFGTAQAALQRAAFSLGATERTVSLGVGFGGTLEVGLSGWLSMQAAAQLSAMPRRSLFTLYEQGALREALLSPSLHVGLVAHSPWR